MNKIFFFKKSFILLFLNCYKKLTKNFEQKVNKFVYQNKYAIKLYVCGKQSRLT